MDISSGTGCHLWEGGGGQGEVLENLKKLYMHPKHHAIHHTIAQQENFDSSPTPDTIVRTKHIVLHKVQFFFTEY